MEDNCTAILGKWRTIVLLYSGDGGQLCFYTWEMEENCTFTLAKWWPIVQFTSRKMMANCTVYILKNDGQLYSLHLEKWWPIVQFTSWKKRETVFTHGNGRSRHKVIMYIRKWRDKLCSLHMRNVGHQKWTHGKLAGEIVHLLVEVWFLMCGGMYHRIYWWISWHTGGGW